MKIITRGEFLKLQTPTIFSKVYCENDQFKISDELNLLMVTSDFSNDFVYLPLSIESTLGGEDDQEWIDRFVAVTEQNKDLVLDFDGTRRDGLFEEDDVKFAVYDILDYSKLLKTLVHTFNLMQTEYTFEMRKN